MARYIDADWLIEKLQETICSKCNMYDGIKCKSCSIDDTLDFLENALTAEVAPIVGHNDPIGEPGEDGLESSIRYAKAEVARKIFEEIEDLYMEEHNGCSVHMSRYEFAELKKKYTEGET